jgi:hypothetical protein
MNKPPDFNPYEAPQIIEANPASIARRPLVQKVFFGTNVSIASVLIVVSIVSMIMERNKPGFLIAIFGLIIMLVPFLWYVILEIRAFLTRSLQSERFVGIVNMICGGALFIVALISSFLELNAQPNKPFWNRFAFFGSMMIAGAYAIACGLYRVSRKKRESEDIYSGDL